MAVMSELLEWGKKSLIGNYNRMDGVMVRAWVALVGCRWQGVHRPVRRVRRGDPWALSSGADRGRDRAGREALACGQSASHGSAD